RFNAAGRAKLERKEREVHAVTRHVAKCAGAEVPKPAPLERDVSRVVRPPWRDAQPEVPIERRWRGRSLFWTFDALWPPVARPVGPDMNRAHFAEHARLYQFHQPARVRVAMALIAHLRGDFVSARR